MQHILEIFFFFCHILVIYLISSVCVCMSSVVKTKKKLVCSAQWDLAGGSKGRAKYANFSTLQVVNIGCNLDSPQTNRAAETGRSWQPECWRNLKDTWAAQTTLRRDLRSYFACPDRVCPHCFLQIKSPPIVFNCARLRYTQRRHHCRFVVFWFGLFPTKK